MDMNTFIPIAFMMLQVKKGIQQTRNTPENKNILLKSLFSIKLEMIKI